MDGLWRQERIGRRLLGVIYESVHERHHVGSQGRRAKNMKSSRLHTCLRGNGSSVDLQYHNKTRNDCDRLRDHAGVCGVHPDWECSEMPSQLDAPQSHLGMFEREWFPRSHLDHSTLQSFNRMFRINCMFAHDPKGTKGNRLSDQAGTWEQIPVLIIHGCFAVVIEVSHLKNNDTKVYKILETIDLRTVLSRKDSLRNYILRSCMRVSKRKMQCSKTQQQQFVGEDY